MRHLVHAALHPREHEWGLRPWGRHSQVVLIGGLIYMATGLTYLTTTPTESRESALWLALEVMPFTGWAAVWSVVGLLAVLSSRWPPASETWGYTALSGLAAWWATCYAIGVVLGAENQSATGALVWALVSALWWGIAGMWNPDSRLVRLAPETPAPLVPPSHDQEG